MPATGPAGPRYSVGATSLLQFNLFAGTVLKLGTKKHHDLLLRGIDTMDDVGCFALTELGFGAWAGSLLRPLQRIYGQRRVGAQHSRGRQHCSRGQHSRRAGC
jgi:alkylation response protein AidB-like acyl-CoA dehydrogenase